MKQIISCAGEWNFELDEQDCGIQEQWFHRSLTNSGFQIPGSTASNHVGEKVVIDKGLTKEAVKCLRQEERYVGVVWYQKRVTIENMELKNQILLYLERVMWESSIWVDGIFVGKRDSLSAAHVYDITEALKGRNEHVLTVRIDNRDIWNIGPYPSGYTDETQTIWNGMIGRIEIQILEESPIEDLMVGVEEEGKKAVFSFPLIKECTKVQNAKWNVTISKTGFEQKEEQILLLQPGQKKVEVKIDLDERIELWDEFQPSLYELKLEFTYEAKQHLCRLTDDRKIGFRYMKTNGRILELNGIQRFLRGNIDCCVYPMTGYPIMKLDEWLDILQRTKEYGFNHVRFHSWCPPHAAFSAADQLGIYLQIEGPVWMDNWTEYTVGSYEEHYKYLPKEAKRIVEEYSWHPSFCIFSNGNELNGDFQLLEDIVKNLKQLNPYLLYTLSTNWDRAVSLEDDIYIAQSADTIGIRGQYFLDQMAAGTTLNFDAGVKTRTIPVVSHEVGQYVTYPNVNEIPKYQGVLKPVNLEAIRQDLMEKGLLSYVPGFIKASGNLAKLLYKAELEAALRTRELSGIQLLGLHDFPGQSTATIGLLDCFFDSKGIVKPEEFRAFCNDVVVLLTMPKFIYTNNEPFKAEILVANYGGKSIEGATIEFSIEDEENHSIFQQCVRVDAIPIGLNEVGFEICEKAFLMLTGRHALKIKAGIAGTKYWNSWDIWVYEEIQEEKQFTNCYKTIDDEAIKKLQSGENILLFPTPNTIREIGPSKFFPVFWSPVHFVSKDPCGMMIDTSHPLFRNYYKTKSYADLEWKSFLENASSINIDKLGDIKPITMLVPNFFNNHKFVNLLEANVLNGKIFICCFNLIECEKQFAEMRAFKRALFDYLNSSDFVPSQRLTLKELRLMFAEEREDDKERINVALCKKACANSELSAANDASKGNDGNPTTKWCAKNKDTGHYWQVDLGSVYPITGVKVVFHEEANYQYVIHTSLDGEDWTLAVNKTDQIKPLKESFDDFKAESRYVRITYNGLSQGTSAGHEDFSVYIN